MADFDFIPFLLQLLAEEKVNTAMTVDIEPQSNWEGQWQYCSLKQVLNLPFAQRYDLAVVNLIKQENIQPENIIAIDHALVRLRDLFAKKIIVLADIGLEKQLRALGFNQLLEAVPENSPVHIWQFNILTYKHVPDWFNSKFWANPENWDKYRW
ncbi:DUF6231 family protein [Acinetobacter populi]|jgi:hypothetical protein|uniref:Uncharacterized protein n=1 Tax=Acinetobacter populi TaxID=1582270 RepID=A0A1Z9YY31_9GAMM|nr:DUF6231 family protein [Acinetobacter populi]MCH4247148.1 DUF6231 family protein [Acinetobacter populi]OUY07117.1 hypothetical protein CAP51_10545 [Acinetobacter populi]